MEIQSISVHKIKVENRLRALDGDYVTLLASSIDVSGLHTPITVTKKGGDLYLVAGAHRLAAVQKLGLDGIKANVIEGDDDTIRLLEIDENLVRRELSALDRAIFLAERKAIYERLYPESAGRKTGAFARWHESDKLSFASDVAEKLRITPRDVRRSIFRALNIVPEVRSRLAGTVFANKGADLDLLARMTPDGQIKIIDALFSPDDPAKSIPDAMKRFSGKDENRTPSDRNAGFERLLSAWKGANSKAREEFVNYLEAEGVI